MDNNILEIGVNNPDTTNIIDFRLRKQAQGINIQGFNYQQRTGKNGDGVKFIREQRVNIGLKMFPHFFGAWSSVTKDLSKYSSTTSLTTSPISSLTISLILCALVEICPSLDEV